VSALQQCATGDCGARGALAGPDFEESLAPARVQIAPGPITTIAMRSAERGCQRQSWRAKHRQILLSVGFSTRYKRKQAACPSCNTRPLPPVS
jgi:hypothetical protein